MAGRCRTSRAAGVTRCAAGPVLTLFVGAGLVCLTGLGGCAGTAEAQSASALPAETASKEAATGEVVTASYVGTASWYGKSFHGQLTASGEPFDMEALTAAHRTLPFGSRVRVTNLANGRSVIVVINDRGPYRKKRLIDLSRAAAKRLGFLEDGTARVRLDVLGEASS